MGGDCTRKELTGPLGKFIQLDESGKARFEEGELSIPKLALEYAAEIFDRHVFGGFIECLPIKTERLEQESPIWLKVQGETVSCQVIRPGGGKPIDIRLSVDLGLVKRALLNKFISLRLYREDEQYMLDVFSGGSEQSVTRQRKKKLVKDLVAWVNKTGNVDLLFDVIESDPATAGEIIKRRQTETKQQPTATSVLQASRGLKGPYEACVATYGSEEHIEKVVVTIVDREHRLIIDHRMWVTDEYGEEASKSIEAAMDALTNDIADYCERNCVGKVTMIDKPLPLAELEEKCPHCGGKNVRVPWRDE